MATTEPTTLLEGVRASAPEPQGPPAPAPQSRESAPVSGPGVVADASLRARTTTLARMASSAARHRRTTVAALLAVALLSASVGVLAGRWLAARAAMEVSPAGETR